MRKTKLKTAAATDIILKADAKEHMNIVHTDADDLITDLISEATIEAELQTGRKFITQTWYLICDNWDEVGELPFGQLSSVASIKYLDEDEDSNTVSTDDYFVTGESTDYGKIVWNDTFTYPTLHDVEAITIEFVVGYGAAAAVPALVKAAIKLMVSNAYYDRDDTEKKSDRAANILNKYRLWREDDIF